MHHHRETNVTKLTLFDEAKKGAHDSKIVRATENLKFSHGGFCQRET